MNDAFENPFADYGKIVRGARFIGRKKMIGVIENRIIQPVDPGNMAIIGMHRIGKSSLAYKTIMEQKERLIAKKILPVWMGLSSYDQPANFFRSLITECVNEMEDLNWLSEQIQRLADRALEADDPWDQIKRFFKKVQEAGYGTLFILDEFDRARFLFKGDTAFQRLRELADYPDYRFSLVLTSRRGIRDIEHEAGSSSPFHNIFQVQRLTMFNDEDLATYFSHFSSIGLSISDDSRVRVLFYCGAHPYLLEMLGCEIVETFRQNRELDVDRAADAIIQSVFEHYDNTIRVLWEEEALNKLLQILFGPVIDVRQTDVTELENYGLIKPSKDGHYVAYSEHFHSYLEMQNRASEFAANLWPIWRDTEKVLRQLITETMLDKYGERWVERLEKQHPRFSRKNPKTGNLGIFEQCRIARQKDEKLFGNRASQNLIDYTYPMQLFEIILAEWDSFKGIFGRDKQYWNQRAEFIAKVRNPLAHNREEALQEYELKIAEGYCEEILDATNALKTSITEKRETNERPA